MINRLQDDLHQHLTQAQAIIDYLNADIAVNNEISVSNEVLANTLWTAQTLLQNANKSYDKLSEAIKQGGKGDE
ncbi:hypothetical protein BKG95_00670 [Rodentibacter pneumotropicus]|uniref:hypothetical protein n=1 Tax=Rodentibacter pneumotropicus TaxID=758 RepID=UPI000989241F|nr:hypothetical protein [Rodentibacter pneumotropicus]OOF68815.1 hypothetical protein BKG95_00670 [Rodentibacter pneumotropicus]